MDFIDSLRPDNAINALSGLFNVSKDQARHLLFSGISTINNGVYRALPVVCIHPTPVDRPGDIRNHSCVPGERTR